MLRPMTAARTPQDPAPRTRVLVVEDAPEFVELLVGLLEREGYEVESAVDGPSAVAAAEASAPDLIVLDLTLPGLDGVEVCRRIRTFSDAYVLMLTARDDEVDRVMGLEVGADDYVTKPFSPRELVARVRAMLRRPRSGPAATADDTTRVIGALSVDPMSRRVVYAGDEIVLTRIEFDLLDSLASKPTMVFSRRMLRDLVWGSDWYGDDHVVDVHVANLRKKLGGDGRLLVETVRGVGYRLGDAGPVAG
jgi:DNA-binding response OmpR family regulator